jgi:hypothetical protein
MLIHTLMREDLDERVSDVFEAPHEVRRRDFIHAVCEVSELVHSRDQLAMLASQQRRDVDRQLRPGRCPVPSQGAKGIENRGRIDSFLDQRTHYR